MKTLIAAVMLATATATAAITGTPTPALANEDALCVRALVIVPFTPAPDSHLPKQNVLIGEQGRIIGLPATPGYLTVQWDLTVDYNGAVRGVNYGVVQNAVAPTQIERARCERSHGE